MAQTSYSGTPSPAIPGGLGNTAPKYVSTRNNENAAALSFGIFVKQGANAGGADLLGLATDPVIGIAIRSDAHPITSDLTGTLSISTVTDFDCLEEGAAWVRADAGSVPGVTDLVYVRFATGAKTVIGAVRKTHDSNTCRLVKGARVLKTGTAPDGSDIVLIHFSRASQHASADANDVSAALAQITATTTVVLGRTRDDRQFLIDSVEIDIPVTGITADDSNYYTFQLLAGAVEVASYATKTTAGQGAITAAAWTAFVNDALASRVVPPQTSLSLVATLTGTKTQPAAIVSVHGRYL